MRIIPPLEQGKFYHLYNRGNNSETIFKEYRNYEYFLRKYNFYCTDVIETYAYALMGNHFHLMIRIRNYDEHASENSASKNASRQLSHFFNCYSQSINKAYNRHGHLFESPFKRKEIVSESHFTSLVLYIHFNPVLHGFVKNIHEWKHSSWHIYYHKRHSFLNTDHILQEFGGYRSFINAHKNFILEPAMEYLFME